LEEALDQNIRSTAMHVEPYSGSRWAQPERYTGGTAFENMAVETLNSNDALRIRLMQHAMETNNGESLTALQQASGPRWQASGYNPDEQVHLAAIGRLYDTINPNELIPYFSDSVGFANFMAWMQASGHRASNMSPGSSLKPASEWAFGGLMKALAGGGIARFSGVGGKSGFVSGMQAGAHGGYSRAAIEGLYASVGRTPPAFPESMTETQLKEYLMSPASPFYGYDIEQFFATRQAGETGMHTGDHKEGWDSTIQTPEEQKLSEHAVKHAHGKKSWDQISDEEVFEKNCRRNQR
jgi:hypothetical protein